MFKKKYHKRSSNPLFVIFRLILSLTMLALLVGGGYSAYKHFSGLDPLKLDPQAVFKSVLSSLKINTSFLKQDNKIIPLSSSQPNKDQQKTSSAYVFRFLLVADSHNDNANLKKAISQAKQKYPDLAFIIGLGDYTNVGTIEELKAAKDELDRSGLRYFLIAGDHDMWDARDKGKDPASNFKQIFGPTFQDFTFNNFKFLLLDNSDNYSGISREEEDWITNQLEKTAHPSEGGKSEGNKGILVFIHEPLYHPSSDHFMGRVESKLKSQAQSLLFQLKQAEVKKIFSGDIHYFSEYEEPVTKIPMVTVGAVTRERNPQLPRFALVSVLEDGSTKVEDVEIK